MGEEALNQLIEEFMKTPQGEKIANDDTIQLLIQEQDQLKKAFTTLTLKEGEGDTSTELQNKKEEVNNKIRSVNKQIASRAPSFKYKVESLVKDDRGNFIEVDVNYVYKITGRVYDAVTTKPLKGVKITPGVYPKLTPPPSSDLAQMELSSTKVDINPSNYTYVPLSFLHVKLNPEKESGVNVYEKDKGEVRTDKDGYFKILVTLPTIAYNQTTPLFFALIMTQKGYIPQKALIVKGDKTIRTDLKAVSITNIKEAAEIAKKELMVKTNEFLDEKVNQYVMDPVDQVLNARQKSVSKLHNIVQTKLLPLVIQLLIAFGITKLSEVEQKTCPTEAGLRQVISKRNGVTRQLNNIYKSVITNTAIAGVFAYLTIKLKGISLKLDSIPALQATGTPPSKDFGGLISSLPYSFTGKIQRIKDTIEEISENNKQLNKKLILALIFILAAIITILLLLRAIDDMSQKCAEELGVDLDEQLALDQELLNLSVEQGLDGNPAINELNGFILSVETDDQNPVGELKRRRAVAKDNRGVTLLQGELSFSSNDQILLDELIFYIQQNNLKA
tara:strand:+ start:1462 stop:3141 length:1680 start_codon:yes stop_codon:yes gene_type:complete